MSELFDALLALPQLAGAEVSPDGRWLAWSWFNIRERADIYVAPTDGSAPPRCIVAGDEDSMLVGWSADSRTLLIAHDHDGDERVQIFAQPLEGGLHPLTEPHPPYFIRGGDLHPDGHTLVYGANCNEQGTVIDPTWVYRHDTHSGQKSVLARPVEPASTVPELSPDGTSILYVTSDRHPAGEQLWHVGFDGSDNRQLVNVGDDRKVDGTWTPDSRHIALLAEAGGYRKVGRFDMESGQLTWIVDDPIRNIEGLDAPRRTTSWVVDEVVKARARTHLLRPNGTLDPIEVPGNFHLVVPIDADARYWVAHHYASWAFDDIVRVDMNNLEPSTFVSLTRISDRARLNASQLARAEEVEWQADDGMPLHGWYYRPRQDPRGTLVHVHGGPTGHSEDAIDADIQVLADAGFAVFDPNYRGSTGYGLEFMESIKKEGWGGAEQDDIRSGIEMLIRNGLAEEGRIGMFGTSYGGYSCWCAVTRYPRRLVAAAAPICGMTDLVLDYESTRPDLRRYSEEMLGGRPDQVPDRYRERSPVHFIHKIEVPILIVQGMQDPNVTPANVEAVKASLDEHRVAYEVLAFPDEGHGIVRPVNRKRLLRRLITFFAKAFSEKP